MTKLLQSIKDGSSTMEIIEDNPAFGFKVKDIDTLRETVNAAKYRSENRDLTVYYLYGASGAGKTRSIYAEHPATSPITVAETAFVSMHTMDSRFWYLRNSILRSPLRVC